MFSEETKKKLDLYDYLLQLTKSKYNTMTQNLNKLAMQRPEEHKRVADGLSSSVTFSGSLNMGLKSRVANSLIELS